MSLLPKLPSATAVARSSSRSGPCFTVVIPTRDRPVLLAQALASVLGQTIDDLEVIVVDDGGTDPDMPADDPRVRAIRLAESHGPAAARNAGAHAARGRYLTFLDDDDLWLPHRLELALAGLARAPVTVCWSRFPEELPTPKVTLEGDVRDVILDHVTPSLIATAIDRDAFVPLDESYPAGEDVEWWLRISHRCEVATVPRCGAIVRHHAGGRAGAAEQARLAGGLRLLDEEAEWFVRHPRAAAMRWQRLGLTAVRAGDPALARRAFGHALRTRPSIRPLVHLARTARPARLARPARTARV